MMNYLPQHYTSTTLIDCIRNGLPVSTKPKRIIIAGAGMSGLVAGSLLKQAGHQVKIIEAKDRIGGRIYTIREPFINGDYFEAGAMRIPSVHYLVLEYVRKFGLSINPFINATLNDIIFANRIKVRSYQYKQNPDCLRYPVALNEKGKTDFELTQIIMAPIINFIHRDPMKNWPIVVHLLERYSLSTLFRHNPGGMSLSDGSIEMIKVLSAVEGLPELSFVEILREYMILFNENLKYFEVSGGMDKLPNAFLPQLKGNIHFNEEIKRIDQTCDGVTISCKNTKSGASSQISGDLAIVTLPFTVLQFIDIQPWHSFCHNKWKAIRELHYVPSTKVGLQFRNRFWEKQGMYGGKSITDLPIRLAHYPSHGFNKKTGVVLGSYTWEDDALIWISKTEEDRVRHTLRYLSHLHGEEIMDDFIVGKAHSWVLDPYAAGAFSFFKPEQESELLPYLSKPEGKIHFAGEHTSLPHGWIQGAIESGIRASLEVNHL